MPQATREEGPDNKKGNTKAKQASVGRFHRLEMGTRRENQRKTLVSIVFSSNNIMAFSYYTRYGE